MSLLMPPDMGRVYSCCSVVRSLHWFPMSLLMPHGMGRVYACCSVVRSLHWFHRRWCQEVRLPCRGIWWERCSYGRQVPASWARLRDVAPSSRVAVASADAAVALARRFPGCLSSMSVKISCERYWTWSHVIFTNYEGNESYAFLLFQQMAW